MSDPTQPDAEGAGAAVATVEAGEALRLITSVPTDEEIGVLWRLAKSLHAARMFKGAEDEQITAEQAFAKILIGRDLGLTPARSLAVLHIVRGNIQVAGKQLLAWVRESEQYDYEVIERTPTRGALQFWEKSKRTGEWEKVGPLTVPVLMDAGSSEITSEPGQITSERVTPIVEPGPIVFTIEEAERAGLVKPQSAWAKWPANMILWRCASIGVNLLCPELTGGTSIYTEADSFDEPPQLAAGEGDGSEPGWIGVSSVQVKALEAMIESAQAKGHAGLSDRATLQMRIAQQTPAFVDAQLAAWGKELADFEPVPDAEVVEPEDAEPAPEEPEQGTLGMSPTVIERLWARIDRRGEDECWEWQRARSARGYGQLWVDGRLEYTHRLVAALVNGPIPEGLHVLHHCDNPPCCNPAHLFYGTQADNLADMAAKGRRNAAPRYARGDEHWTRRHPERVLRGDAHPRRRATNA